MDTTTNPNAAFQTGTDPALIAATYAPKLSSPIDASTLGSSPTPFTLPAAPATPNYAATLGSIPSSTSIISQEDTKTPAEVTNDNLDAQLLEQQQKLVGKSAAQTTAETNAGLPGFQSQLTDITGQIQSLQKEAQSIPLQDQQNATGRGITAAGLAPVDTGLLRENTIKSLGLSAIAQTLQGNIALAQQTADKAVAAEFDPIQAQIDYLNKAIELNAPNMTKEEKTQADQVQAQLQDRQTQLDQQKTDKATIISWAAAAVKNNPGNQAVQLAATQALQTGDLQTAFGLVGQYQTDPTATAQALADLAQTRAQTNYTNSEAAKDYAAASPSGGGSSSVSLPDGSSLSVPSSLQAYFNTSNNGVNYVDLSSVSASDRDKLAQQAGASGLKVITDKNTAADLLNIRNANMNLDTVASIMKDVNSPDALSRDLYGAGLTDASTLAQSNPKAAAASAVDDIASDIAKTISGLQGNRTNSQTLATITKNLPTATDTAAVTAQKLENLRTLINNRETAIVGKAPAVDSGPPIAPALAQKASTAGFDIQGALKSGYSISDIQTYLNTL